jgi:sigma-B regulation protein RsbU (phosphoserine phosphatase)
MSAAKAAAPLRTKERLLSLKDRMSTATQSQVDVNSFLLEIADVVNTSLDLDTVLRRVAELVSRVLDYEVFAILLLNERTQKLRIRFSVGHPPEVAEKLRIKLGEGVTGQAALRREPVLVNDVRRFTNYISSAPEVRSELAVPLIIKNRVIGVVDVESSKPGHFSEEHKHLLALIASRLASGIENARLYTRVSRQAKSLALLNEISRELTAILNLDELLHRIAERVLQLIDFQMFSILLLDERGEKLQHRFAMRFKESVQIKHDIPVGSGIVGHAARYREPVLVPDVTKDQRYINVNPETRSELAVPLIFKGNVIGVLDLEHTRRAFFTEDHVRTMVTLAAQIAIAIENARLYERVAQEEKRLERDLAMAHELQSRLLPSSCPQVLNAEVAARFASARAIGGDLYDFIPYSRASLPVVIGEEIYDFPAAAPGRTAIAVGDVSGKGSAAALYAALVSGFLRSHAATEPRAAEMLHVLNGSLSGRPIEAQYVSVVYAVWDGQQRRIEIANSGLPLPVFCRKGEIKTIEAAGLPLGLFAEADYDAVEIEAQPGDVLVIFSDGITDAVNAHGKAFGRGCIEKTIAENSERSAEEILRALFAAVEKHSAGVAAFDDETAVVLKVK